MDETHEANIDPHVAIEDVAEFVGDDALEFLSREVTHAAPRDADHGVAGRETCGESVDAVFLVEEVDRRGGRSTRDGHFFDNIEKLSAVPVPCVTG